MKKLDLTVCMREKEYGQALARGLAYITPNLDITVCDAGYGNSKMVPGSVIITDDRGLTGENILQLDQILPAGEILEHLFLSEFIMIVYTTCMEGFKRENANFRPFVSRET